MVYARTPARAQPELALQKVVIEGGPGPTLAVRGVHEAECVPGARRIRIRVERSKTPNVSCQRFGVGVAGWPGV